MCYFDFLLVQRDYLMLRLYDILSISTCCNQIDQVALEIDQDLSKMFLSDTLTGPCHFKVPLIKENEFSFPVVDRGLSLHLADFCHLAAPIFILHPHCQQQLLQLVRRPVCCVSLCPAHKMGLKESKLHLK